jgi:hypothetical protein
VRRNTETRLGYVFGPVKFVDSLEYAVQIDYSTDYGTEMAVIDIMRIKCVYEQNEVLVYELYDDSPIC